MPSSGILPHQKPKLSRINKINALERKIKNRTEPIDKVLGDFSIDYSVTQRHLREDYIKSLLTSKRIEAFEFKSSKLITKKFLTRLGMSLNPNEGEKPK